MKRYIVRLDDACPTMHHENWHRMECLLDKYGVKPIVGVIPENHDPEFSWPNDVNFWQRVRNWQKKGWIIAQHGLYHVYQAEKPECVYFQRSHSIHTEWAGRSLAEQIAMMQKGRNILLEHNVNPVCFFAPAHTFDTATVKACKRTDESWFISDGYALHAYKKADMIFLPSICDGPFLMKLPGVYTFVTHPSKMDESAFERWEKFLAKAAVCSEFSDVMVEAAKGQFYTQGLNGRLMEWGIYMARAIWRKIRCLQYIKANI